MVRLSWALLLSGFMLASAGSWGQPSPSAAVQAAQEQLQVAAKEDDAANEKAGCFCQTNLAEKQQTVDNMQQRDTQLSHDMDETKARINQLDIEVKMHSEELESSSQALATAEAIRQKDSDKFTEEQQSHTDSIDQLQSALGAVRKHGSIDVALIAVRRVTKRVSGQTQKKQLMQLQRRLQGRNSPDQVAGVLQHMVTTFSRDLQDVREDERVAKSRHEEIVSAKSQEIKAQKKHMLGKTQRLAKSKVTLGFNEQIKERSAKLLDANVQLLNSLKKLCSRSDASYTARRDAVQAEIEALSGAQAELAGASFLGVAQHVQGDGAEKVCAASIEIQEQSWKDRARSACKLARKADTASKQAAADNIEELESDIREAQDEAGRKQDDCTRANQGAQDEAAIASKQESAEANFVGSEQQSSEEQIQELTSQGENADKSKSQYDQVSLAQQKAVQALRVATTRGKESLKNAADRAGMPAASKINEAINDSEKLMQEADSFAADLESEKQEVGALWDSVKLTAGKVMIPLRLMRADSEEAAIAIRENGESRAHARTPQCDAAELGAKVAKLKSYRSMLGKAAEGLAWETLR